MNYYRRYMGDYAKATARLGMLEHGAYALLLDYYYASEMPLPKELREVYAIAKATSPAQRKAVSRVLNLFFHESDDGWHQSRADEEIASSRQAIEKQRVSGKEAAQKRWNVDRSTHRSTNGSTHVPSSGLSMGCGYNHQPPTTNQTKETTPATLTRTTERPDPPAGGAGESKPNPETVAHVDRLRVTAAQGTDLHAKVGELYGICVANSIRCSTTHPLLLDWAREGLTTAQLTRAISEARKANSGQLNPAYLDPILERIRNGTIDVKAPPAPLAASHSPQKARQAIAEGLQAKQSAVPMPDAIRALLKPPKPAIQAEPKDELDL